MWINFHLENSSQVDALVLVSFFFFFSIFIPPPFLTSLSMFAFCPRPMSLNYETIDGLDAWYAPNKSDNYLDVSSIH